MRTESMELDELRKALAKVDGDILRLVAERQSLARAIGELKDRSDLSLRDFAQEKVVLERTRELAEQVGLSGDMAQDLMRRLIRDSLTIQERQRLKRRGSGSGRRALVIGGAGRMGGWFTRFLASQDFSVAIADPEEPRDEVDWVEDWRRADLDSEMIVVAADLRTTGEILGALAEVRPPGLIFDIGSLKTPLRRPLQLLAAEGCRVTSIHPMFGPRTELLHGCHVIVVDLGCAEANRDVAAVFDSTMAQVVEMPLDDHDRVVAYILGLSHALNIAFFTALAESGEAAPHLARLSSTTFDSQLEVAAAVAEDNPSLYFEIQYLNEYGNASLSALQRSVEQLRAVVGAGDEASFAELMLQGRSYLADRSSAQR